MKKLLFSSIVFLLSLPSLSAQGLSAADEDNFQENILHMLWTAEDGNYDSTIIYGQAAVKIDPSRAETWDLLAEAYQHQGDKLYYMLTLAQTFKWYNDEEANLIPYTKSELNKILEKGLKELDSSITADMDYDQLRAKDSLLDTLYSKINVLFNSDQYTEALQTANECLNYALIDHELLQKLDLANFLVGDNFTTLLYANLILYLTGDDYRGGYGKYTLGFTNYEKALANATEGIIFSNYPFLIELGCERLHTALDLGIDVKEQIEKLCN